jgi:catechol 2,3-dioxygenase-like lactoylglutathione lyase family enzyme
VDFLRVSLRVSDTSLTALRDFYGGRLGIPVLDDRSDLVAFGIGTTRLEFRAGDGAPFYHFALLVPGDRFARALEWAGTCTELLPDRESGEVVFDFTNWSAEACYFHDPAGNIVELIAHRGLGESSAEGAFAAGELLGLSELGLVGSPAALADGLAPLGLELWDGSVEGEGRLGFVGERGRTLILSSVGRGWLPTGRRAEPHPVEAVLSGPPEGEVVANGYRITRSARPRRAGA